MCLFIYFIIYLYLFVYIFIYIFIYHLSICLSVYLFIYLFIYALTKLPVAQDIAAYNGIINKEWNGTEVEGSSRGLI